MRAWILVGLGALALALAVAGCAGSPAEPPADLAPDAAVVSVMADDPSHSSPGFDIWGTGKESYFYHRLSGNCEALQHRHGRNAAWGAWHLPLAQIAEGGPEEGEYGGVVLRFHCIDGSACIHKGALSSLPDRVDSHTIPFETMQGARDFSIRVANLRVACGIGG